MWVRNSGNFHGIEFTERKGGKDTVLFLELQTKQKTAFWVSTLIDSFINLQSLYVRAFLLLLWTSWRTILRVKRGATLCEKKWRWKWNGTWGNGVWTQSTSNFTFLKPKHNFQLVVSKAKRGFVFEFSSCDQKINSLFIQIRSSQTNINNTIFYKGHEWKK